MKINEEYTLTTGKDGFEDTERLMLTNIAKLAEPLPRIENLVSLATVVNHKALHELILLKRKEQTMEYTERLKMRANFPQISKLREELTPLGIAVTRFLDCRVRFNRFKTGKNYHQP